MNKEQKRVKDWMVKFGQETPEKPTIPSLEVRKLRAKLILEEALETIHAMNLHLYVKRNHYEDDMLEDDSIGFWEDPKDSPNLVAIADGLADLKVVTEGTAVACGIDLEPVFDEVMRSNDSKLWNTHDLRHLPNPRTEYTVICTHCNNDILGCPCDVTLEDRCHLVKDRDGKVIKSPSYSKANIQQILEKQTNENYYSSVVNYSKPSDFSES